ncbi:MAG: hypothetical protein EOM20_11615 [Spartobacteria bacterium]|nr:hypothetical protein [Spartobacteria bacterium]
MKTFSSIVAVECFHLAFLSFFGRKVDKRDYALKGGCNLRFFLGSPRYSEDMDLDVVSIPVHVLQERVNGILHSDSFRHLLQTRQISIEHITEHKQSETTQRWKLGLLIPDEPRSIPTKLEFSRRGFDGEPLFEAVDPDIPRQYNIMAFMCPHYPAEVACLHKIGALASRSVPQARDVFDLHLLWSKERIALVRHALKQVDIQQAAGNLAALGYDHFMSQVVAYLPPDEQRIYEQEDVWDQIQMTLFERLEAL